MQPCLLLANPGLPKVIHRLLASGLITQEESRPRRGVEVLLKAWFLSKVMLRGVCHAHGRGWLCRDLYVAGSAPGDGAESLQMVSSVLPTSGDENQVGLAHGRKQEQGEKERAKWWGSSFHGWGDEGRKEAESRFLWHSQRLIDADLCLSPGDM